MKRPLLGEPLPLDLVDTDWVEHGEPVDWFDDVARVAEWLAAFGLPGDAEAVREPLRATRAAMRAALAGDQRELDAVLDRGSVRPRLRDGVPYEEVIVADPAWHAAWVSAAAFVRLLGERPERVRKCANPECVLWFLDVSKNGSRRWCSMEGCGNRAKVGRFNQRSRNLVDRGQTG
ncbi:CGNR zinc finger domain-containing protein [Nonomuraea sp. NPDC050310]|uniref:CGNR zinc finger domain-containing protein n=1 Tax=unclassified Nonomuraea TaxID=2593643 RepID=UPI0033E0F529